MSLSKGNYTPNSAEIPVYIELDWEEQFEPLYGSPIIIPVNTMLWRGYDIRYPSIGIRFAYYSGREIVTEYSKKQYRQLGCFVTQKPLKILDIRFMINILERIIQTNRTDKNINDFASTMLSFGLCSLGHQILLLKQRYQDLLKKNTEDAKVMKASISKMIEYYKPGNLIEQKGIRIAETTNDGITMAFIQELFKGEFDGFISPRLETVFHIEKGGQLNPELILFNPKMSNIIQISRYQSKVILRSISELLKDKHQIIDIRKIINGEKISMKMYLSGGKIYNKHHLDDFEDKLNNKDKKTLIKYNNAIKRGKEWRKHLIIINPDEVTPQVQVSPFPKSLNIE